MNEINGYKTRMLYILNSAVLTSFGIYVYSPLDVSDAKRLLRENPNFISTIGYEETAVALSNLLGIQIPVNRIAIKMERGDQAIVFRLILPPGTPRIDPKDKGSILGHITAGHWELGLLENR